ncbi:hypothetical protein [Marisediminicola sp. LYQ134]|uniref:hypothetical protein n=1 Tax=Marisediminicola sp. LYQ134 TaxID=3391061 RepID=UPI00398376A0
MTPLGKPPVPGSPDTDVEADVDADTDADTDAAVTAAWRVAERRWASAEPRPETLRLGDWTIETRGDEFADIRFAGRTVLRSIRAVARDRDWNTVATSVTATSARTDGLDLDVRMSGHGLELTGRLAVTGARTDTLEQTLTVALSLEAQAEFERNRIGLVVLHPPTVAGTELVVTTPSTTSVSSFPDRISPHQPAVDIVGLGWHTGGLECSLRFDGEIFEMEDQRNWTDASFKTYGTPLAEPFPVTVSRGEVIAQTVTLTARITAVDGIQQDAAPHRHEERGAHAVDIAEAARRVPHLVLGATTGPPIVRRDSPAVAHAPVIPASAVLVELDVATPWREALVAASREAGALPLDVRIVGVRDTHTLARILDDVVAVLSLERVVRIGAFAEHGHVADAEIVSALAAHLRERSWRPDIVGGTRGHFTELNRSAGVVEGVEAVSFSITPQMHAVERAQLVESIAVQREVVENATRIAVGLPVHVGPITLRPRFNAVATSAPDTTGPGSEEYGSEKHGAEDNGAAGYGAALLPEATDPRQASPALAAWVVASAAALARPGVASLAYFEIDGPRGIRGVPVERAVAALHEIAGLPLLEAVAAPLEVWALGAVVDDRRVLMLANLRSTPVTITVGGEAGNGQRVTVASLDFERLEWTV